MYILSTREVEREVKALKKILKDIDISNPQSLLTVQAELLTHLKKHPDFIEYTRDHLREMQFGPSVGLFSDSINRLDDLILQLDKGNLDEKDTGYLFNIYKFVLLSSIRDESGGGLLQRIKRISRNNAFSNTIISFGEVLAATKQVNDLQIAFKKDKKFLSSLSELMDTSGKKLNAAISNSLNSKTGAVFSGVAAFAANPDKIDPFMLLWSYVQQNPMLAPGLVFLGVILFIFGVLVSIGGYTEDPKKSDAFLSNLGGILMLLGFISFVGGASSLAFLTGGGVRSLLR